MQRVSTTVGDRGRVDLKSGGRSAIQIVEYCTPTKVFLDFLPDLLADSLKERMARGDPFQRGVFGETSFVEGDPPILPAQRAEAGFQTFPNRLKVPWMRPTA